MMANIFAIAINIRLNIISVENPFSMPKNISKGQTTIIRRVIF